METCCGCAPGREGAIVNGNEEREGGESYLNANTDPAQIVLIVKRERGSMALG